MSHHVSGRAIKGAVALAAVLLAATALSGCTAAGSRAFGDPMVTGSTASNNGTGNLNQPMPPDLGATTRVAGGPFLPPENVGGGSGGNVGGFSAGTGMLVPGEGRATVSTQDLPILNSATPLGTQQTMPAQQTLAPITVTTQTANTSGSSAPSPAGATAGGYAHTIQSGESLYTIARRYNVTTQAIVQANNLSSPDKIIVGQKVIIPGRPDLAVVSGGPEGSDITQSPIVSQSAANANGGGAISDPKLLVSNVQPQPQTRAGGRQTQIVQANAGATQAQPQAQPQQQPQVQQQASVNAGQPTQQPQQMPLQEPAVSGADKFRWPVSGRVITDFASSKGTGINIEVPEGASVKAAENGTVIYVGNGVEGYGNMILIRHANGYVSAYAHLKDAKVGKGATVNRGDTIGSAGMTGSVSRPQLHFELRKGATPVDPIPLLAS